MLNPVYGCRCGGGGDGDGGWGMGMGGGWLYDNEAFKIILIYGSLVIV